MRAIDQGLLFDVGKVQGLEFPTELNLNHVRDTRPCLRTHPPLAMACLIYR